jgi:outer membrane immunogenic protein
MVLRKLVSGGLGARGAILACAAVLGAGAQAADIYRGGNLPLPAAPPPAAYVDAPWSWTGVYAGLSVGYGWGGSEHYYERDGHGTANTDVEGWLGGVTLGYNQQYGSLVLGVEGDFNALDVKGDDQIIFDDHVWKPQWGDWLATVRGRIGIAFGGTMVYGTGGLAFADSNEYTIGNTPQEGADGRGVRTGWVAGAGIEQKLSERVSAKIEWLHFDFDDSEGTNFGPEGNLEPWSFKGDMDVVKAGINFKLN